MLMCPLSGSMRLELCAPSLLGTGDHGYRQMLKSAHKKGLVTSQAAPALHGSEEGQRGIDPRRESRRTPPQGCKARPPKRVEGAKGGRHADPWEQRSAQRWHARELGRDGKASRIRVPRDAALKRGRALPPPPHARAQRMGGGPMRPKRAGMVGMVGRVGSGPTRAGFNFFIRGSARTKGRRGGRRSTARGGRRGRKMERIMKMRISLHRFRR